jgi:hypothetical protein
MLWAKARHEAYRAEAVARAAVSGVSPEISNGTKREIPI